MIWPNMIGNRKELIRSYAAALPQRAEFITRPFTHLAGGKKVIDQYGVNTSSGKRIFTAQDFPYLQSLNRW